MPEITSKHRRRRQPQTGLRYRTGGQRTIGSAEHRWKHHMAVGVEHGGIDQLAPCFGDLGSRSCHARHRHA